MENVKTASDYILDFDKSIDNISDVKIFFGEYDGIQRYDRYKYPISERLVRAQQAATWFPREINFSKDRVGYNSVLSKSFQEAYSLNLLFQTTADSLANRFLDNLLSEYITSPEWEAVIKWQAHFELLHSEAYSWNIREVYSEPEKFFNEGFKNPEIRKRLNIEKNVYSKLKDKINYGSDNEKKLALLKAIATQNALENIRFFVSFLYTFKINELNGQVLQGSVNNIKLILNDEIIHTVIFRSIINILRTVEDEGFKHLFDDTFYDIDLMMANSFDDVIESEMEWFRYLSSVQEIQGFTEEEIRKFLEYYTHTALSLTKNKYADKYYNKQNEIVMFFESKKNLNNVKALAQETNLLTYNIGVLDDGGFSDGDLSVDHIVEDLLGVR